MEATRHQAWQSKGRPLAAALLIALSATVAAPAATADPPVPPQPSVVETLLWLREAVMDYLSDMEPVGTIEVLELPEEILERACVVVFGDEDCPINFALIPFVPGAWVDPIDVSQFDPLHNKLTIGIAGYGLVDDGQGSVEPVTGYYWFMSGT